MNCEEVKNHLTDYLEKALDVATTTRVATHIISCPPCRVEAAELTDCIQQIGALPLIDPPIDFAQRVMAQVREIEPSSSVWQRWMAAAGKHIPLQAAAVVLIAMMAGFLYQKENQLKNPNVNDVTTRAELAARQITKVQSSAVNAPMNEKKAAPAAPAAAINTKSLEIAALKKTKTLVETEPLQSAKGENSPVEPRQEENRAVKRPPITVQEVSNPRDAGRLSGDTFGFDFGIPAAPFRQPASRPESANIERPMAPLFERSADIEFVVHRLASTRRDQADGLSADSLRKSAESNGSSGSLASGVASQATARSKVESIAEIRFYNVAPEHFESFKKDLAQESLIETETRLSNSQRQAIAQASRPLLIKVTILPPAAEDSSGPSR